MQSDCPYQLIELLGSTRLGTVWSAADEQGVPLTVALLDAAAAVDPGQRDAFVAAVNALAKSPAGAPRVVNSGFQGPSPWMACASGNGPGAELVFQSLGVPYVPAQTSGLADAEHPPVQPDLESTQRVDSAAAVPGSPWAPRPASPPESVNQQPVPQPGGPAQTMAEPQAEAMPPIHWPLAPLTTSPVSAPPLSETPPAPPVTEAPIPTALPAFEAPPVIPAAEIPPATTPHVPAPAPTPQPTFPQPADPAHGPWPWSNRDPAQPALLPAASPYAPPPQYPSFFGEPPAKRRRTWLWVTIGVVAVLLVGAGAFAGWRAFGGAGSVRAGSSPTASSGSGPAPAASPLRPGLEPPLPGDWPSRWPKFGPTDKVSTQTPEGLGVKLTLPASWKCVRAGSANGYVKYTCGTTVGNDQIGGDVIVRNCAAPCDAQQQTTMRSTEEAWGLQWRQAGQNATIVETTKLNGDSRYALVLVAYWHSTPSGPLDHQLVLRMTAPVTWVDDLRRIANALRDSVVF
jgi:hypothetical protein